MVFVLFIIVGVHDSHVILLLCYYRTPVDRDFKKMTRHDCSQIVTHYGGNEFGNLLDVTVTPNDEIVIVENDNKCVVVLDNKLNLLKVIGQGKGINTLVNPEGVAVTDNVIAVSDYGSNQVKKYSLQGELLSVIGCYGNQNGQFSWPRGLAFNNNKVLYVVDSGNRRVQVFQQDDTFAFLFGTRKIGHPGHLQYPVRIAIDPNNNVLVTDLHANCINIFTDKGQFIQTINSDSPCAITISPTGYLITGYSSNYKIRVWSPTYHIINRIGKKGSKQREFLDIRSIAMDSRGTIYVAEYLNSRLQVIGNS